MGRGASDAEVYLQVSLPSPSTGGNSKAASAYISMDIAMTSARNRVSAMDHGKLWTIIGGVAGVLGLIWAVYTYSPQIDDTERPPNVPPAPQATQYHSGIVTLNPDYTNIDLDSTSADWSGNAPEVYLGTSSGRPALRLTSFTQSLRPTYDDCKSLTTYDDVTISLDAITPNDGGCMRTSDGRFAGVVFSSTSSSRYTADLKVLVWNHP
jgi:hypothetical protein